MVILTKEQESVRTIAERLREKDALIYTAEGVSIKDKRWMEAECYKFADTLEAMHFIYEFGKQEAAEFNEDSPKSVLQIIADDTLRIWAKDKVCPDNEVPKGVSLKCEAITPYELSGRTFRTATLKVDDNVVSKAKSENSNGAEISAQ